MASPPAKSPTKSPSVGSNDHGLIAPQMQNSLDVDSDAVVLADEGFDEAEDGQSGISTSLASSVRDYVFENNRRYHKYKEGKYLLPNDEPEQEREDMKHALVVSLCDSKLHFAPLSNPQQVLDVGTGTGIWAIDMADEYPEAEVIGIDLSPIQPTWVPPNVRFQVDDGESDWVWQPGSLDFVHLRHMGAAVKNWPRLVRQAYDALKPGGWIELQDLRLRPLCDDGTMPEGSDYGFARFIALITEGFAKFGVKLSAAEIYRDLLVDGGFTKVEEKVWKVPIGPWAKDPKLKTVGVYNQCVISDALQGVSMAPLTRGLKWSSDEVELFLIDVRKSLMNSNIHSYYTFHAVFGQKPTE